MMETAAAITWYDSCHFQKLALQEGTQTLFCLLLRCRTGRREKLAACSSPLPIFWKSHSLVLPFRLEVFRSRLLLWSLFAAAPEVDRSLCAQRPAFAAFAVPINEVATVMTVVLRTWWQQFCRTFHSPPNPETETHKTRKSTLRLRSPLTRSLRKLPSGLLEWPGVSEVSRTSRMTRAESPDFCGHFGVSDDSCLV